MMIPPEIAPYLPYIALGGGSLVTLVLFALAYGRGQLRRRPALVAGIILAIVPALYMGLVWTRLAPESYLRLARPWATGIGLLAMIWVAYRLGRYVQRQGRARTFLSDALVALAVLASSLAAAGPEIGKPLDRLTIIAVVDRSRSTDLVLDAQTIIGRNLTFAEQSMGEHDLIGTVVFGANAATEQPPRSREDLPTAQRVDIGRDGTDLSAGIKRALADVPADSAARLVLLSDGVATRGDVMAAAAAAVASEIPIDILPLDQRELADVRVVSFRVTPRAAEGETIGMRVVIASPTDAEVEVRIKQDGVVVKKVPATVRAGEDVVRIKMAAPDSGLHRYDVEVTARDQNIDETAEDNAASAFIRVRGPARVLVLDGDAGKTTFMAEALRKANFRVEEGSTSSVPADVGAMAGYDLIIMGDIPAKDLAVGQIDAFASYVKKLGGGLILTGGDRSFGPGGYGRTPIEEISPVSFDLKQERRRASLAEIIAIDISGSMAMNVGAQTKLELANEAAARSAKLLGKGDLLGVVHVDTAPNWAVPLAPVLDKDAIDRAIRSVGPGGGGILVDVALKEAYAALGKVSVNLKHVILFADGADAENITPEVQQWVTNALAAGITTSCVSLGRGVHSGLLEDLSKRGSGRFYMVEDATRLPAVFAQETILAAKSSLAERPFQVALGTQSEVIAGIDFGAAPALMGYVVNIPKPRATVSLLGPDSDPVLATWPVGVGHAAVFTSDLKDRWGEAWTTWDGAARMLAQLARHVARRGDDNRVRLEADASGGQLRLRATVVDDDGRLSSFRRLKATVTGPDGFERDVPLDAAGAGTYGATIPLSRPGSYIAVAKDEEDDTPVATTGAALHTGEEMRPTGTDIVTLTRIAEITGGKNRDSLAGIFHDRAALRFSYRDITIYVLFFAAGALLLAVAARRLSLPPALYTWATAPRARPAKRDPHPAAGAQATLDALLKAKTREPPAPAPAPSPSPAPAPAAAPAPSLPAGATLAERLAAERLDAERRRAATRAAPAPTEAPRVPTAAATPVAPKADGPPPSGRPLTAAEILLQRRKGRKG
jgi:Ca-activated chloride channel family protein